MEIFTYIMYYDVMNDIGGDIMSGGKDINKFSVIFSFVVSIICIWLFAAMDMLLGGILIAIVVIPFGFFLPMASRYRSLLGTVFYSFGLSLCVETFQLFSRVGSFDVDDLLLNTIGGLAGYIIFVICAAIRRRHVTKKKKSKKRR